MSVPQAWTVSQPASSIVLTSKLSIHEEYGYGLPLSTQLQSGHKYGRHFMEAFMKTMLNWKKKVYIEKNQEFYHFTQYD